MNNPIDPYLLHRLETEHQDLRLELSRLSRKQAPPELIKSLKLQFIGTPWSRLMNAWFRWPVIWKPIGVLAVAALIAGVWISKWKSAEAEFIDAQPLVVAHSRYQAETLVPPGDMAGSNFGAQLAVYYGESN